MIPNDPPNRPELLNWADAEQVALMLDAVRELARAYAIEPQELLVLMTRPCDGITCGDIVRRCSCRSLL